MICVTEMLLGGGGGVLEGEKSLSGNLLLQTDLWSFLLKEIK